MYRRLSCRALVCFVDWCAPGADMVFGVCSGGFRTDGTAEFSTVHVVEETCRCDAHISARFSVIYTFYVWIRVRDLVSVAMSAAADWGRV